MKRVYFDAIWAIAAASGVAAAWSYGHPVSGFPLLSPMLLCIGIGLAAYLSIFAQKVQAGCDSVSLSVEVKPEPLAAVGPQKIQVNVRDFQSSVVRYRHVMQARIVKDPWAIPDPLLGLTLERYEEVVQSQITSYGRQASGRINLLNDAVHIARQLRGSGLQVEITKDDALLVREVDAPGDSQKGTEQLPDNVSPPNPDWVN